VARTGEFGRRPRSQPTLTATLVAIAREMQSRRDQNIMDAWKNGGYFEGEKVTDAMVLAYWRGRLKGISKADPLYDTYSNAVLQIEYSIAESKMSAAYAQKTDPTPADDLAMAKFYTDWAKKVPSDSEFYRVLQRDAGQFTRSAAAKRRALADKNKDDAYRTRMTTLGKGRDASDIALWVLTRIAQQGIDGHGAVIGQTMSGGPGNILNSSNLDALTIGGIDGLLPLIAAVNETNGAPTESGAAHSNVLFYDETGKAVTGQDVLNMLSAADPDFDGTFDLGYVQDSVRKGQEAIRSMIALAKSEGRLSDAQQLTMEASKLTEFGAEAAAWPVLQIYDDLKRELNDVFADPSLKPLVKQQEMHRILGLIGNLANDPRIATDGNLQSMLRNEANLTGSTLSVAESLTGLQSGTSKDIAVLAAADAQWDQWGEDAANGGVWTQGKFEMQGDKSVFVPVPGGSEWGVVDPADLRNIQGASSVVTMAVPTGNGTGTMTVSIVTMPVTVTAQDPISGQTIQHTNNNNGQVTRVALVDGEMYFRKVNDKGEEVWTKEDPTGGALKPSFTKDGLVYNMTDMLASAKPGSQLPAGWKWVPTSDGGARIVLADPKAATSALNPTWKTADNSTDSWSLTLLHYSTKGSDGKRMLEALSQDPEFMAQLDNEAHAAAGQTLIVDPKTGATAWSQTNMAAYQKYVASYTNATLPAWKSHGESTTYLEPEWNKGPLEPKPGETPLPTTTISQNPEADMQTLAASFQPGTTQIAPTPAPSATPTINMGQPLTLPGGMQVGPTFTPFPTGTQPYTLPTSSPKPDQWQTTPTTLGGTMPLYNTTSAGSVGNVVNKYGLANR
jgi:hypothetical protein